MRSAVVFAVTLLLVPSLLIRADDKPAKPPPPAKNSGFMEGIPKGYKRQVMQGFVLWVSDEVLKHNDDSDYKRKPLEVLELELKTIKDIMKPAAVDILRGGLLTWVEWDENVELKNGASGRAEAVFVSGNRLAALNEGKHPLKINNITILSMKMMTEEHQPKRGADPKDEKLERCVLLHEMAHAVHHFYLNSGFNNPDVIQTYNQAMDRKLYFDAKDRNGGIIAKTYASTNANEYFAEISCAYLDRLYYFPFNREDLQQHDPIGYKLMVQVWGKTRDQLLAEKTAKPEKTKPTVSANVAQEKPKPSTPAADDPDKAEKAAASKLKLSKVLMDAGKKAEARESLEELLKKYPETKAADEAKGLLEQSQKQ